MTIVENRVDRAVTGGVDTHLEVHVAAALDPIGGLLGVESFPTTPAGYAALTGWLAGWFRAGGPGRNRGTGSYGAGLARHLHGAGVKVIEVNRTDRAARRQQGKSDPLDAVSAARAARSGRAKGSSKGRDGHVEAIRTLMVTKRSARRDRTATVNQMPRVGVECPRLLWPGWSDGAAKDCGVTRPGGGERRLAGRQRRPCALGLAVGPASARSVS